MQRPVPGEELREPPFALVYLIVGPHPVYVRFDRMLHFIEAVLVRQRYYQSEGGVVHPHEVIVSRAGDQTLLDHKRKRDIETGLRLYPCDSPSRPCGS
jgi:hypothetical protein